MDEPRVELPRAPLTGRLVSALPNALTLSRVGLAAVFPFVAAEWRIGVVVAAALTDLLDGFISRQLHAATTLGRILDPVADKLFVIAVVATLWVEGLLAWWEGLLVGLRDVVVLLGVAWVLARRDWRRFRRMPPTLLGKVATAAQFLFFLLLLYYGERMPAAFWVTAALSAVAAADYARVFVTWLKRA